MLAALLESSTQPPVLTHLDMPAPGPDEALIRMHAAALNPVDLHIWSGRFFDGPPQFPYVPGAEGVGVVEIGRRLAPGTRVRVELVHPGYGRDGTLAQYVVVPELPDSEDRRSQAMAFPIPDHLDDVAAAGLGACGCTALTVLERAIEAGADLSGARVLVLGATGAVGQCAVQLARAMGAQRVVAVGRNASRLERMRELGADSSVQLTAAVDPTALRDQIIDAADGRLDVVIDPLWGDPARAAIEALDTNGVFVSFGHAASPTAELTPMPLRNRRVTLVGHSGAWTTPESRRATFERLLAIIDRHPLTLDVEELALRDVAVGWQRLRDSAGGKLVVTPHD